MKRDRIFRNSHFTVKHDKFRIDPLLRKLQKMTEPFIVFFDDILMHTILPIFVLCGKKNPVPDIDEPVLETDSLLYIFFIDCQV